MTIRIQHLTIDTDTDTWLRAPEEGFDALTVWGIPTNLFHTDLLAMVRHIMRDEPCTVIPVVHAAVAHPVNEWGHNFQVEVTYSKNGYRAIYAGRIGENGVTNVQCYMD